MTVSSPLMVVIGIVMLARLFARRNNMRRGVLLVWSVVFTIVTALAALKVLGLWPSFA